MEDDLQWKTTLGGRRPLVEEDLQWKTPFGGRRPLVEDDLWWKMTFGGRRPSVEDDFPWKMPFGGRRPSVEDEKNSCGPFLRFLVMMPTLSNSISFYTLIKTSESNLISFQQSCIIIKLLQINKFQYWILQQFLAFIPGLSLSSLSFYFLKNSIIIRQ